MESGAEGVPPGEVRREGTQAFVEAPRCAVGDEVTALFGGEVGVGRYVWAQVIAGEPKRWQQYTKPATTSSHRPQ